MSKSHFAALLQGSLQLSTISRSLGIKPKTEFTSEDEGKLKATGISIRGIALPCPTIFKLGFVSAPYDLLDSTKATLRGTVLKLPCIFGSF